MFTANSTERKQPNTEVCCTLRVRPPRPSEFRNLEESYTILADNEEWLAHNADKILRARAGTPRSL
jgi:hypothetical protein